VSYRTARADSTISGGIFIQPDTRLQGTFISCILPGYSTFTRQPPGPSITIGPGTVIKGYVLTDNDINIKEAVIEGTLWARSVIAYDDSISYTNALLDIKINECRESIAFPLLGNTPVRVVVDR
jgi:hypothetical protein